MAQRGTSFTLKNLDQPGKLVKFLTSVPEQVDKEMLKRMNAAVQMVYVIAHQKRPYISQQQAKSEGRARIRGTKKFHLVSDPNAQAGVPVAQMNGGTLQASIKKNVTQASGRTIGVVYVDDPGYAEYMEFGTSKIAPRPFMRPAMLLVQDALSKLFKQKISFTAKR